MNHHVLKIQQIHKNKISDAFLKSVKGLPKEAHLSVHTAVKQLQCVRRIGVSFLVPEGSSAFSEAIFLEVSNNLYCHENV